MILVLTVISLYCQNSYPKKLIIEGDTTIVISLPQLKKINKTILDKKDQDIYINSLERNFEQLILINGKQISLNDLLCEKNNNLLIQNSDLIKLNTSNKQIQSYYKKEIANYKQKQVKIAFVGGLVGVSITSIMFLILNK